MDVLYLSINDVTHNPPLPTIQVRRYKLVQLIVSFKMRILNRKLVEEIVNSPQVWALGRSVLPSFHLKKYFQARIVFVFVIAVASVIGKKNVSCYC